MKAREEGGGIFQLDDEQKQWPLKLYKLPAKEDISCFAAKGKEPGF